MSQLPDLPPMPRRTRPVPHGGLQAAVRTGRRRRNVFLGAAGGSVTAVVLAAAALATFPGSRTESLQPADQRPAPTGVVATSPAQPAVTSASAATAGDPAALNTASRRGVTAAAPARSPRPQTSPSPAAASATRSRDDFTESPRDVPAPQTCRQAAPSGHTGPVYYGGAPACSVSSSGPSKIKRGGRVSASTDICMAYGAGSSALGYDGGQEHEVVVTDSRGLLVYRFSQTVTFVQGRHVRSVEDGRCLEWTGTWDTRTTKGALVPAGRYTVTLSLAPDTVDGRRTTTGENSSMGFSVDVE